MVIDKDNVEEMLEEWKQSSDMLKQIKREEMDLRKDIVNFLAPDGLPGIHRQGFTAFIAKATIKLNHKFDEPLLETLYDTFSEAEKNAVKYKPSLSQTEYKKIAIENREKLDDCIIVTIAAPTLNVEWRSDDNE